MICPDNCEHQTENAPDNEGGCYFCNKFNKPLKDASDNNFMHLFSAEMLPECNKEREEEQNDQG